MQEHRLITQCSAQGHLWGEQKQYIQCIYLIKTCILPITYILYVYKSIMLNILPHFRSNPSLRPTSTTCRSPDSSQIVGRYVNTYAHSPIYSPHYRLLPLYVTCARAVSGFGLFWGMFSGPSPGGACMACMSVWCCSLFARVPSWDALIDNEMRHVLGWSSSRQSIPPPPRALHCPCTQIGACVDINTMLRILSG
jgi:hypothetical protein